ncbi:MAG: TAXI family TRAP transporter solute-binding subunit [Chloroflexi bacterium]|nr:TAXI family TRAP transporter solute-binding subunit [Chloroflexota bacterium]
MRQFPTRTLALLTLLALILSACGQPDATTESSGSTTTASGSASASPAPETPAPSAAASASASAAPLASPAGGAVGYQEPCTPEAASSEAPPTPRRLVVGTGGTGGVFYPYGGGIARILTERLADTEATAEVTGGSVDNMKLIQAGDADLGLSTVDSAYDALQGQASYESTGKVPACTLAVLYPSFLHVIALESSGINSIADMKGKRVSVGSAGSSTEDAADRLIEAGGLNPQSDITRDNLSVAESVAAMKDQKIDAFFWIGGLPTSAVTDLVATPGLTVKFLPTAELVPQLSEKYGPVYTNFALPGGTYAGFDADIPGIGINNILFVNANMNEQLAYDILKTLFDNLEEVKGIHPEAQKLSLEAAVKGSSIPFHPGAIRFFQEKGVWPSQ